MCGTLPLNVCHGFPLAGAAAKGPKRPQPLAPLCKFPGMAGAVQPWEGPPVVLDGGQGYRCALQSVHCGFLVFW